MANLVYGLFFSVFMVLLTVMLYYEVLRVIWQILPRLQIQPRLRILCVALAIFAGHTAAVWMYGVFYWFAVNHLQLGQLQHQMSADMITDFLSCVYFSASTYSSLGFGDVFPTGVLRLITGVEVLNGLVLIGWSASFTYLAMEKFWDLHRRRVTLIEEQK